MIKLVNTLTDQINLFIKESHPGLVAIEVKCSSSEKLSITFLRKDLKDLMYSGINQTSGIAFSSFIPWNYIQFSIKCANTIDAFNKALLKKIKNDSAVLENVKTLVDLIKDFKKFNDTHDNFSKIAKRIESYIDNPTLTVSMHSNMFYIHPDSESMSNGAVFILTESGIGQWKRWGSENCWSSVFSKVKYTGSEIEIMKKKLNDIESLQANLSNFKMDELTKEFLELYKRSNALKDKITKLIK